MRNSFSDHKIFYYKNVKHINLIFHLTCTDIVGLKTYRWLFIVNDGKMFASVDVTDVRIYEPIPFDTNWFSHQVSWAGTSVWDRSFSPLWQNSVGKWAFLMRVQYRYYNIFWKMKRVNTTWRKCSGWLRLTLHCDVYYFVHCIDERCYSQRSTGPSWDSKSASQNI